MFRWGGPKQRAVLALLVLDAGRVVPVGQRARAVLAEELGLEPGEELRELAQAVLRQEVPAVPRPERHRLPVPLTSFVGREEELAALDQLLGRARLVTDFYLGAHAVLAGYRLLTRDVRRCRTYFPAIDIIAPPPDDETLAA